MEDEKLISLVYDRKPLWDINSKNTKDFSRKLWREIAEELNTTSDVVKRKWQQLRGNFRAEYGKVSKAPKGSKVRSSWKFYNQLLFLVDVLSSRKYKGNISSVSSQVSELAVVINEEEENDCVKGNDNISNRDIEHLELRKRSGEPQRDPTLRTMRFKKPKIEMKTTNAEPSDINQHLSLKERKTDPLEIMHKTKNNTSKDYEKDADYHFLMSLLPHLRDIPKSRKLETRIRIQQVLMEEESAANLQSPNSSE